MMSCEKTVKSASLPGSMLPTLSVAIGDRVRATGGVGGGYGNPLNREAEKVASDVADGYLTPEEALGAFGVALNAMGQVDAEATRIARRL